jgi:hypothetical protein
MVGLGRAQLLGFLLKLRGCAFRLRGNSLARSTERQLPPLLLGA